MEVDIGSRLDIEVVRPQITDRDEELSSSLVTDAGTASHVRFIADLIDEHESVLLFVNTRQTAEALGSRFKELGTDLGVHHGSLSKEARIDVEDRFKAGDLDALLCTSSMELGIDVGHVDHVVQYGSPRQVSRLVQRVGRAGHRRDLVSSGTVVTTDTDDTLEALAIARQAEAGDVEPAEIHDGSLDTVANQIAGLVMDTGEIRAMRAYEILTRAYPFRDLDEAQFKQVVEELAANNVIWLDEDRDTLEKRRGTWQYFYQNLSMIPDEATYDVEDVASGQQVGTLDEKFVVNFATPGEVFVQRGEMWRITNIDEEEEVVTVSPIEDPAGEVPSWVGQEIPVPRAVAAEVGELRRVAGRQLQDGADTEAVARDVATRYAAGPETVAEGLSQVEKHEGPIPDDTTILVEFYGREVIVNACYGHKINETLGRVLSALLGQRAGSSVAMDVDPYRITLEVPRRITAGDVIEVIEDTDPDHLPALIELSLKNADALKFKLAQVATKFGSLKRWRGRGSTDFGRDRLLAALEDTPMYDEALREVRHEDLAIEATADLLRDIQRGDVALETVANTRQSGLAAVPPGGNSSHRRTPTRASSKPSRSASRVTASSSHVCTARSGTANSRSSACGSSRRVRSVARPESPR